MKISSDLHIFETMRALVIAAGRQRARIYAVKDQEIREIDFIEVETPKYSDREGFFMRSGRGGSYGSGAPYENKKQKVENDFLKQLGKRLPKHLTKFEEVYIFCPRYMHKMIEAQFPKGKEGVIKKVFSGNIVDTNPLKFTEKIATFIGNTGEASRRSSAKPEARKIIKKSEKAAQVLKIKKTK